MLQKADKVPVMVGVTGHRNTVGADGSEIKQKISESLKEILGFCGAENGVNAPVIMLNALAQGADLLCAEVAFELGLDIYAVLPCKVEKYRQSFNAYRSAAESANGAQRDAGALKAATAKDEADMRKLNEYLSRAKRVIYAPDVEKSREKFLKDGVMDGDSYEYRQLGIYMAENSHILLALWDGKPPKGNFGCGTAEVIDFALERNFLSGSGAVKAEKNSSAVIWIKTRRQGDDGKKDVARKWLFADSDDGGSGCERYGKYLAADAPPGFLLQSLRRNR